MNNLKNYLKTVVLFICVCACGQEDEIILPVVETSDPTDITLGGAILKGRLIEAGTEPISEMGFLWSDVSGISIDNGTKIALPEVASSVFFEMPVEEFQRGKDYYFVAFVVSSGKTFLGSEKSFTTASHTVAAIEPSRAYAGDEVIISGSGFGTLVDALNVSIGDKVLVVNTVSDTQITGSIPEDISGGNKQIRVTIEGDEVVASQEVSLAPKIETLQPALGFEGDQVEITGSGFTSQSSEILVKFGAQQAQVSSVDLNKIVLTIPQDSPGLNTVSITVNSVTELVDEQFNILAWQKLADLPISGRYAASSFIIDGQLYLGLGASLNNTRFSDFWKVDLGTGNATQLNDFPGDTRFGAESFSINGKGYVLMGFDATTAVSTSLWQYDPQTDEWSPKANFPGIPRSSPVAFVLNGKIYAGTGIANGVNHLDDFYSYNPSTDQWMQEESFAPGGAYGLGSFVVGSKAYVACGVNSAEVINSSFWEFDGSSWTQLQDYPGTLITDGKGFGSDQFGLFGFGWIDANNAGIENWKFDQSNSQWSQKNNFPGPQRFSTISGYNQDYWYMGLGYMGNTHYSDVWIIRF